MNLCAIYTGFYLPGLPLATERFPELLRMHEGELYEFSRDWERLSGCWVNSAYLLDGGIPPESVHIVGRSGKVMPLTAHPEWENCKGSVSAGEFYTHVGMDWIDEPILVAAV